MAGLGDVSVTLGLNVRDFQRGLKQAETSLKDVGEGFSKVGEGLTKAITVPLLAVGATALSGSDMIQKSQNQIQNQLGMTGKEAEKLQGVVNNLFTSGLGGSMEEVTSAVTNVKQNIHSLNGASDKVVENVTKGTMNIAKSFDQDGNDITKTVNAMQNSFDGLSVDKAMDMITVGFQNGLDYSGEFLDSVNEYGPQFSNMGFSAEEMFSIFQAGAESGAFQLDKVGDLIKEMNIRLSDGTADEAMQSMSKHTQDLYKNFQKTGKGGDEVFQAVMKDLDGMKDKSKAYTLGQAIMGTQFEDLGQKGVSALANIKNGYDNVDGATGKLMKLSFSEQMVASWRKIQVALAPVGDALADLAAKYMPPLIAKIQQLATWFTGLSSQGQLVVVSLAGIAAVFPIILIAIGSFISAIGSIAGAISGTIAIVSKLKTVFTGVQAAMNMTKLVGLVTSPVGLIIIAITALVAAGILIWKNWDTIKAKALEIWGAISSFFTSTWSSIKSGISSFLSATGKWFTDKWNSIKTTTSNVFNAVKDFLVKWGLKLLTAIPLVKFVLLIVKNWDKIKSATSKAFNAVVNFIKSIFSKAVSIVTSIASKIWNAVKSAWGKVKSVTSSIFGAVRDKISTIWYKVATIIKTVVTRVLSTVSKIWNTLKSTTVRIFNGMKSAVTTTFSNLKSKISSVVSGIWSKVKSVFTKVKSAMTKPIESAKKTISSAISKIKSFFSGLVLKIPKPKLPKISISKGEKKMFGATIPYPKFSVSWHEAGGIFEGSRNGTVVGIAENGGDEAIIPLSKRNRMKPFASAIASLIGTPEESKDDSAGVINQFNISQLVVREEADVKRIAEELEKQQRQQSRAQGRFVY